jgi:hypothetical protein
MNDPNYLAACDILSAALRETLRQGPAIRLSSSKS